MKHFFDKIKMDNKYLQIGLYFLFFEVIAYILTASFETENIKITFRAIIAALPILIYLNIVFGKYIYQNASFKKESPKNKKIKIIFVAASAIILYFLPLDYSIKISTIWLIINIVFSLNSMISIDIAMNFFVFGCLFLIGGYNDFAEILSILGVFFWLIGIIEDMITNKLNTETNKNNIEISLGINKEIKELYGMFTIGAIISIIINFALFKNLVFEINGFFSILYGFLFIISGVFVFSKKFGLKEIQKNLFIRYFFIALILPFFYFAINLLGTILR